MDSEGLFRDPVCMKSMANTLPGADAARESSPLGYGGWKDADVLRPWSFVRPAPQQRLDWLIAGLALVYQTGALKPTPRAD